MRFILYLFFIVISFSFASCADHFCECTYKYKFIGGPLESKETTTIRASKRTAKSLCSEKEGTFYNGLDTTIVNCILY